MGSIITAWWSTDHLLAPNVLYYDEGHRSGTAMLNATAPVSCPDADSDVLEVIKEDGSRWGSVQECKSGPAPLWEDSHGGRDAPPPTVILQDDENKV